MFEFYDGKPVREWACECRKRSYGFDRYNVDKHTWSSMHMCKTICYVSEGDGGTAVRVDLIDSEGEIWAATYYFVPRA